MVRNRTTPFWRRVVSLAGAAGLALVSSGAIAGTGEALQCKGRDLIPVLQRDNPKIHQRLAEKAGKTLNADAILWRVSDPKRTDNAPSYLFGTIHVSDQRVAMPPPVQDALDASRTLAVEVEDLSAGAISKAVARDPRLIVYLDGQRLDSKIAPERFALLQGHLKGFGLPAEMAGVVRPWFAMLLLALPDCEHRRMKSGRAALDVQMTNYAKQKKIRIIGLETLSSQMKAMAGIPEADQLRFLELSLAFASQREDQLETVVQAYLSRKLGYALLVGDALAEAWKVKGYDSRSFKRILIDDRNAGMFQKSRPLVDTGGAMIAVGALHLVGESGLVALYRQAGYRVEPLH